MPGERRAGAVHPDRGVGAEHQLADRPVQARGGGGAAELGEGAEAPVLGVHPRLVALLERLRHRRGAGLRVEDRRVAVAVLVRRGEVLAGEPVDLGEDRPGGLAVDLGERALAQDVVPAEHLEEVELDVAQVALVVAHCSTYPSRGTAGDSSVLLVGNLILGAALVARASEVSRISPARAEVGARPGELTTTRAVICTGSSQDTNLMDLSSSYDHSVMVRSPSDQRGITHAQAPRPRLRRPVGPAHRRLPRHGVRRHVVHAAPGRRGRSRGRLGRRPLLRDRHLAGLRLLPPQARQRRLEDRVDPGGPRLRRRLRRRDLPVQPARRHGRSRGWPACCWRSAST